MLDIVITHYMEEWEVGEKLFRMIAMQRCIRFDAIRVTVVNDGGNRIPEEKLNMLPYYVEQVDIPHGGISAARNAGIDHATEKWIMFCDFDDCFASIYSLREYLNVLDSADMDMIWSRIMAEDYVDGKQLLFYVPDKQRFVFCHGKVYRTEFLRKDGIRFEEDLVFNEDSCFNAVIIARTPHERIGEIKSPFPLYTWIRRESSVTNSGREDEAEYGHFRRNMKVTEENRLHREHKSYCGMVTRTVYDTYYMIFGRRISIRMKRKILEEFTPWISDRISVFGKVDTNTLDEVRVISRSELIDMDEIIPDGHELIVKWVNGLVKTYQKVG